MDGDWLTTGQAAEMWNEVVDPRVLELFGGKRSMSGWTMRKLCRDGVLERLGIRVDVKPGAYYVSRASVAAFLWEMGQSAARRAEAAVGITQARIYEIIGEVGASHPGKGKQMDDLWRETMQAEFKSREAP